jgi:hypothetical protein
MISGLNNGMMHCCMYRFFGRHLNSFYITTEHPSKVGFKCGWRARRPNPLVVIKLGMGNDETRNGNGDIYNKVYREQFF